MASQYRRLAPAVLAGCLVVAGFAGCAVESGRSAAYVGATRYSRAQVDRIVAGIVTDGQKIQDSQLPVVRQQVAAALVFLDVAHRFARDSGYGDPDIDYAGEAARFGLPETDAFARLEAQAAGYGQLLVDKATPATPTEAQYREVYANLVAGGATVPYEQVRPELAKVAAIGQSLAARDALRAAMRRYRVRVNPVYGAVAFTLLVVHDGNGNPYRAVVLPLTEAPAVVGG